MKERTIKQLHENAKRRKIAYVIKKGKIKGTIKG